MNYKKIYKDLYIKAKNRKNQNFKGEKHHFIPVSVFKTKYKKLIEEILEIKIDELNSELHIKKLTIKEHYIAHLLLFKIFPNLSHIMYGLNQVMNRYGNSNKFVNAKIKIYKMISEKNKGKVTCFNKITKESFYVSKEEFEKNKNLVGANYFSDANKKVYKCKYCRKEIKGKANLIQHENNYCELGPKISPKGLEKIKCKYCGKEIVKIRLKRHENACQKNPNRKKLTYDKKIIKCKYCGEEGYSNIIRRHEKYECKLNKNKLEKKKPKTVKCKFCGEFFNSRGIHSHIKKCKKIREVEKNES